MTRNSNWKSHWLLIAMAAFLVVVAVAGPQCVDLVTHRRLVRQANGLLTSSEVHSIHDLARAKLHEALPDIGLVSVELLQFGPSRWEVQFRTVFRQSNQDVGLDVTFDKTSDGWHVVRMMTIGGWR
jgi:hypothetical protein